jgi:hypothetical protein
MVRRLSKQDVEAAFVEMGELLVRGRKIAEIAVYRGASIMLQFDVQFRTGDVDAHIESGDHGALINAAAEVAQRRGWLRSWFSEAVTQYLGSNASTEFYRSYPSDSRVGLHVYLAKPDYLLAMKLRAMQIASRDEDDAVMLAHATGITTVDGMLELLKMYFPKEGADARRVAIIGQFAKTLNATPPKDIG